MVGEAATFWNETVSDLGLPAAFAEPLSATPPSGLRPFENYAHQLSQLAGRLHSSAPGPAPPPALLGLDAEVVVLLSAQALSPIRAGATINAPSTARRPRTRGAW